MSLGFGGYDHPYINEKAASSGVKASMNHPRGELGEVAGSALDAPPPADSLLPVPSDVTLQFKNSVNNSSQGYRSRLT